MLPIIINRASIAWLFLVGVVLPNYSAVLHVDQNSIAPSPPYASWGVAATNIQDAIAAAQSGDLILVADGVYNAGAYSLLDLSRIIITNAVEVRSVNGPDTTIIQGYQLPGTTNGVGAVRCAVVGSGAVLSGFTLTGGATSASGSYNSGGGVYCPSDLATVTNCIISSNAAAFRGGGGFGGRYERCLFIGNTAPGSATPSTAGGGVANAKLYNCVLVGNRANTGGGASGGSLVNCTVSGNTAVSTAGGTSQSSLINTIVYNNTAPSSPNYTEPLFMLGISHCCMMPLPSTGPGCFTNAPLFIDPAAGNFQLQSGSPCINSGLNAYATNSADLANNPRIAGGTADIGAYEYVAPSSTISYQWLQQYGMTWNGTADRQDPDGDRLDNFGEWMAETNPTNAASVLRVSLVGADATGITLRWDSVYRKFYRVECSTNLSDIPAFFALSTNYFGQTGTTTYKDSRATNTGPYFYRVGTSR